jgi:hypothetical protein
MVESVCQPNDRQIYQNASSTSPPVNAEPGKAEGGNTSILQLGQATWDSN